ncbi:MAG: pseudaminic acid cytidylyltransferase [bacterium]
MKKKYYRMVAIIPARGGSKRIPQKNIKKFHGVPIIKYSIDVAIKSKIFDSVIVSTDDKKIAKVAKEFGAEVPFFRSKKSSSDSASLTDAMIETLERLAKLNCRPKYCCMIFATNPTISVKRLKAAFDLLTKYNADSVIPVAEYPSPVQRALKIKRGILKLVDNKYEFTRSQYLPKRYYDSGRFIFFKTSSFLRNKSFFMRKTRAMILPHLLVQDIDSEEDWKLAELKFDLKNFKSDRLGKEKLN